MFKTSLYQIINLLNVSFLCCRNKTQPYLEKSSRIVRKYIFLFKDGNTGPTKSRCISSKTCFVLLVDLLKGLFLNFELEHIWHLWFVLVYFKLSIILVMSKWPRRLCQRSKSCWLFIYVELISFKFSKLLFLWKTDSVFDKYILNIFLLSAADWYILLPLSS